MAELAAPGPVRARRGFVLRHQNALLFAVLLVGALVTLVPFVWMVSTSLTSEAGLATPSLVPAEPSLDAYRTLLDAVPFPRAALNSLVLAVVSTASQVLTGALAAYAFARLQFPGRNALFVLYLATQMVPVEVRIVPLFIEMRSFDLVDTYAAVLAPTLASAFGVFMMRQAITAVPTELDDAARIDGAGHLRIFAQIILPLIRPTVATFAVFAFMASWNSFLWPLVIIRSPEFMTLPVALSNLQGQYTTDWNVLMAGSVLSVIPILVFYLLAQRHVIQSVALAGLK